MVSSGFTMSNGTGIALIGDTQRVSANLKVHAHNSIDKIEDFALLKCTTEPSSNKEA